MEQFLEWNMEILRVIATWRTAVGDFFFALITHMGEETIFFAVLLLVYWCVDKRRGYYLFAVSLSGNILFNVMKIAFHIARPWVLDPSFQIVEAAREAAAGYSFPSGHSLSVVALWTSLMITSKKTWVKIIAPFFAVLVPFSRLYLGVHTPFDVVVGIVMAFILVAAFYPMFKNEERAQKCTKWALLIMGILVVGSFVYIMLAKDSFPHGTEEELANLASAVKNAYTYLAYIAAFSIAYIVDVKKLHYDTKAPFWGQVLKYVFGVAVVFGLKTFLKQPLNLLIGDEGLASAVRYFIMALAIGVFWPMTFPLWQKIGKKPNKSEAE